MKTKSLQSFFIILFLCASLPSCNGQSIANPPIPTSTITVAPFSSATPAKTASLEATEPPGIDFQPSTFSDQQVGTNINLHDVLPAADPSIETDSFLDHLVILSPDGSIVAKIDSDGNTLLPHPDKMSYRNEVTGDTSEYNFKGMSSDGTWAIYGNHDQPDIKMLVKSKLFQYGAYIINPENPALVGVSVDAENNTISIIPIPSPKID